MVAPVLAALTAANQLSTTAAKVALEVKRFVEEDRRLETKLRIALTALGSRADIVSCSVLANKERFIGAQKEARMLQLQEILYDIEDFLQQRRRTPGPLKRKLLMSVGLDARPEAIEEINGFSDRLKMLMELKVDEEDDGGDVQPPPPPPPTIAYPMDSDLLGIAEPKAKLLEMLRRDSAGKPLMRAVCVVGRRGVGKTALASSLYNHICASRMYDLTAWVVASDCSDTTALLQKLLDSICEVAEVAGETIGEILATKRFLLVIDDMQEGPLFHDIKAMLPENRNSSAILITTNIRSAANACGGQLYEVRGLTDANSRKLFWEKVQVTQSGALDDALSRMFDTCEGVPLALISTARHLLQKGKTILTIKDCQEEGLALGRYLIGQGTATSFDDMRRSLSTCYINLPDYIHRMCLLSTCMFPKGHSIRTKTMARELVAVGLVAGGKGRLDEERIACLCLDGLMDKNIIEPLTVGVDYDVKRFQIGGKLMLEFVVHKAAHKNFAVLIHEGDCFPTCPVSATRVRRLFIDSDTEQIQMPVEQVELYSVRWLRIYSTKVPLDLKNCKLLRVLDLEGSKGVNRKVMKSVCKLLFLKYLGLRRSDVEVIPKKIEKLKMLEILDFRETEVASLPIEVFKLPKLACVFGQFQPPHSPKRRATLEHLHTLAGLVLTHWEAFDQTMRQAGGNLRKVKIWCGDLPAEGTPCLIDRIQERIEVLQTVAINSNHICDQLVSVLTAASAIVTLKLQGTLMRLPDAGLLMSLAQLRELHIVSSGLSCEELSVLQTIPGLVYLRLGQSGGFRHGQFTCQTHGFKCLQRLRFEAPKLPKVVVEVGGMPCLATFDLLCPEYSSMDPLPPPFVMTSVERFEWFVGFTGLATLGNLKEVNLHQGTAEEKVKKWKSSCMLFESIPSVKKYVQVQDEAQMLR